MHGNEWVDYWVNLGGTIMWIMFSVMIVAVLGMKIQIAREKKEAERTALREKMISKQRQITRAASDDTEKQRRIDAKTNELRAKTFNKIYDDIIPSGARGSIKQ